LHFAASAAALEVVTMDEDVDVDEDEVVDEDGDNVTSQQTTVEKVRQALLFNCGIKLNGFCSSSIRHCIYFEMAEYGKSL